MKYTTTTRYLGARVSPKIKEAIENVVPDKYVSVSHFVQEAIVEKLKRENLV
jgi:Arc/MetJ-type ribon-helix-helix transcriptional regulator